MIRIKMKACILVLFICMFISVNARDVSLLTGDVDEVLELLNVNRLSPVETIDKDDMLRLKNGIHLYSLLEKMLSDKDNIQIPVSTECMLAGMKLYEPLQKFGKNWTQIIPALLRLPLGKMLDAWGKVPERVLLGNVYWLGAHDECTTLKNVDVKYCRTTMYIFGQKPKGTRPGASYGSCFPKQCTAADVGKVLSIANTYTKGAITFNPDATICEENTKYNTGTIITIVIMSLILALCLVGTVIEQCIDTVESRRLNYQGIENKGAAIMVIENENAEEAASDGLAKREKRKTSGAQNLIENAEPKSHDKGLIGFFLCFSLQRNTSAILSTKSPDGAIKSINGIRVISMTWVVLGHYYAFANIMYAVADNVANLMKIIHRFSFMAIADAFVSVDSFFLLSGVLVAYLTLKRIDRRNGMGILEILVFYLHRFIRLTPSLGMVILLYTYILPVITKGPNSFVVFQTDSLQKPCYDYWWSTLFYFNNFMDINKMCIIWSWYLSNDMQFYLISPFILLLMVFIEKRFKKGILHNSILIVSMCCVSMLITGIITGVFNIPALMMAQIIPNNPRSNQTKFVMDRVYIKPYCRIPPYLVGMFLGYMFSRKITLNIKSRKMIVILGWIIAIITGLSIVYGPWKLYKEHGTPFNDAENVAYASFNRFAWGCAVAWVIYACHNKAGGLVDKFLSWGFWIPLSRLTYGTYLIHVLVILFFTLSNDHNPHYQDSMAVFDFISVTFVSYACSFILAVCLEFPIVNLEKKIFKR